MQNISSRELHKQIQMHLESLRLSGVEWLENNNNSTLQISEGLAHKSPPVDGEAAVTNLPLPEKSSTHSVLHSLEKKTGLLQLDYDFPVFAAHQMRQQSSFLKSGLGQ